MVHLFDSDEDLSLMEISATIVEIEDGDGDNDTGLHKLGYGEESRLELT